MNKKIYKNKTGKNKGIILVQTILFGVVAVVIMGALSGWAATTIKAGRIAFNREQAFQSSEAGIDYYRWHLAHAPTDYQDGTGVEGPYVHELEDKNGNAIGQFSLDINAPISGSTLVKIKSTGISNLDPKYQRIILSQVAKPSIAKYAFYNSLIFRIKIGDR